jgi:hypothetical protein
VCSKASVVAVWHLWIRRFSKIPSSTKELNAAINDYIHHHNRDPKPFIWHKTADQIVDSVARFYK